MYELSLNFFTAVLFSEKESLRYVPDIKGMPSVTFNTYIVGPYMDDWWYQLWSSKGYLYVCQDCDYRN